MSSYYEDIFDDPYDETNNECIIGFFEKHTKPIENLVKESKHRMENMNPFDGEHDEFVDSLKAVNEFYEEAMYGKAMVLAHFRIYSKAIKYLDRYI